MNYEAVRQQLMIDEGVRLHPYTDTVGKLTIGIGRNLTDDGITIGEAGYLLDNDISTVVTQLDKSVSWWRSLSEARQEVMVNWAFNVGIVGLLGFKLAIAAIQAGNYVEGAAQMRDSEWYKQVGGRAIRLASLMENGE